MAEGEWRNVILKTIRESPSKKEGKVGEGYGLWVVARIKPDNTLFSVTVRSGRYYPNKVTGEKEIPKDGLGFYDFMALNDKSKTPGAEFVWDEVKPMLDPKTPPVIPAPNAPEPAAAEPPIEEMPW
jgi:hypothetical protein